MYMLVAGTVKMLNLQDIIDFLKVNMHVKPI